MLARHLACTTLAALLGRCAPRTRPRHQPVPGRSDPHPGDRRDRRRQGQADLSFSTSSFLSLTLGDTSGGKSVRIVVDSMLGDSATPIPAAVFDSARGAEFHAFLSAAGKLSDLEAVNVSPAAPRCRDF